MVGWTMSCENDAPSPRALVHELIELLQQSTTVRTHESTYLGHIALSHVDVVPVAKLLKRGIRDKTMNIMG